MLSIQVQKAGSMYSTEDGNLNRTRNWTQPLNWHIPLWIVNVPHLKEIVTLAYSQRQVTPSKNGFQGIDTTSCTVHTCVEKLSFRLCTELEHRQNSHLSLISQSNIHPHPKNIHHLQPKVLKIKSEDELIHLRPIHMTVQDLLLVYRPTQPRGSVRSWKPGRESHSSAKRESYLETKTKQNFINLSKKLVFTNHVPWASTWLKRKALNGCCI
jgi:hypothetical protein